MGRRLPVGHGLLLLVGGLIGWCALATAWPHVAPDDSDGLTVLGFALTAAVFVAAGGIQLARARITADPLFRWSAASLLLAGSAILLLGALSALDGPGWSGAPRPGPLAHALVVVPALVLLGIGAAGRAAPSGRALRRIVAGLVGGYLLTGVALAMPGVRTALRHTDHSAGWLVLGALSITGWAVLAARTATARRAGPYARWRALAFALTSGFEAAYTVGLRVDTAMADRLAAGLALAAGGAALAAAGAGLRLALADSSRRMLRLDADLDRARRLLERSERLAAERRHDAQSALLGLGGATRLLSAPPAVRDLAREDLTRVIAIELQRLERLLGAGDRTGDDEPVTEFALADALGPLVTAQRLTGQSVAAEFGSVRVRGRRAALAGAFANLLTNAARHAPGARVHVRAVRASHTVSIVVDDDGPGIPAAERATVTLRGARGSTSAAPGSGLGLYTAATAMIVQNGALHLDERPGGGTRAVLTLPAAGSMVQTRTAPGVGLAG